MSATVTCPVCNREFYHEDKKIVTCSGCDHTFALEQSGKPAWKRVAPIGYLLIILAIFGLVSNLGIVFFLPTEIGAERAAEMDPELVNSANAGASMRNLGLAICTLVIYPWMLLGAIQMLRGRGWGLAFSACVLAVLPCGVVWLISLFIGIWGLIDLRRPEIKGSFR